MRTALIEKNGTVASFIFLTRQKVFRQLIEVFKMTNKAEVQSLFLKSAFQLMVLHGVCVDIN